MIERLAKEIVKGKYYHVFVHDKYLKSFYFKDAADCWKSCGYKVVYLGR